MNNISFFTPVCSNKETDSTELFLLDKVDHYFYLGGKEAVILSGDSTNIKNVELIHSTAHLNALKIASYFTLILPLIALIAKIILRSKYEFKVLNSAPLFNTPSHPKDSHRVGISPKTTVAVIAPSIEIVPEYTGDLSPVEKSAIKTECNHVILKISFDGHQRFNFTLRMQDMFESQAQVIVNAANTYLGGGGGIDGAIHKTGGNDYVQAH